MTKCFLLVGVKLILQQMLHGGGSHPGVASYILQPCICVAKFSTIFIGRKNLNGYHGNGGARKLLCTWLGQVFGTLQLPVGVTSFLSIFFARSSKKEAGVTLNTQISI